jgi:hypothetical protein
MTNDVYYEDHPPATLYHPGNTFYRCPSMDSKSPTQEEEPSWKRGMIRFEKRRNKNVTKASGEKSLNLEKKHEHTQSIS